MEYDAKHLAESLQKAIRCKTISAENLRDDEEFNKFHLFIKERYPTIYGICEYKNIDGGIFIKISGQSGANPLVLMSHLDVVPENGKWSFDPWAGEITDKVIKGRGAVDTKGSLIAIFESVEGLLKEGLKLKNDLYILSSSREEIAGDDIKKMIDIMKKRGVKPHLVIDEGGGIIDPPVPGVAGKFAMIGMIERSSSRIVIEGETQEDIGKFKKYIQKKHLGVRDFGPINEGMFNAMLPKMNFLMRCVFGHLNVFKPLLIKILPLVNESAKIIIGPTFYVEKPRNNEKPKYYKNLAVYRLSGNFYNKIDDLNDEFIKLAEKFNLKAWVSYCRETPEPEPLDGWGYKFIKDVILDVFDGIGVSPYCILGGTDARHFVGYADSVIRFAPIYMNNQQFSSFHKTDENINILSLVGAVKFYKEVILRVNNTF